MATAVFAANNESYRQRLRAHRACQQCKRRRVGPLPPTVATYQRTRHARTGNPADAFSAAANRR